MIPAAIEARNLTKIYKLRGKKRKKHKRDFVKALDGFNITVKKGETFGLLGPNGAGKTTFLQLLTTSLTPTSGEAYLDGYNIVTNTKMAKSRIFPMFGSGMLYPGLKAYDNLKYFCKIFRIRNYEQKIIEVTTSLGLDEWLDVYTLKYSSGMRVKLAFCRLLLIDRPILLLDEPFRGLDVKIKDFLINILKESNKTILLASHNMDVVEKLCDSIAFIKQGKLIKMGTKDDIKSIKQSEFQFEVKINKITEMLSEIKNLDYVVNIEQNSTSFIITIKNRIYFNDIISKLTKYRILMIREIESTIEESFKKIV